MKTLCLAQDLCCLGAVAMGAQAPLLTAMGHRVMLAPTAVYSSHFGYPRVNTLHTDDFIKTISEAWGQDVPCADAFFVGAMPVPDMAQALTRLRGTLGDPPLWVDPVMADHGKLYRFASPRMVDAIKALCDEAALIFPNLTEAKVLCGLAPDADLPVSDVLARLRARYKASIVLTGVWEEDKVIDLVWAEDANEATALPQAPWPRPYPGAGDVYAALVSGYLLRGTALLEAARLAQQAVRAAALNTNPAGDSRLGLDLSPIFPLILPTTL